MSRDDWPEQTGNQYGQMEDHLENWLHRDCVRCGSRLENPYPDSRYIKLRPPNKKAYYRFYCGSCWPIIRQLIDEKAP